jgi:hypothetical protein
MDTILLLLAFVFVVYFTFKLVNTYSEALYVESNKDKKRYLIRRGRTKSEAYLKESAETLAEINDRVSKLIEHLNREYAMDTSKNYFIKKLKDNYGANLLSEAAVDERFTTFTVNKQDIHICLRTRDQLETVYEINLLMYVILHELAHLCNYDREGNAIQGHGDEFKYIFKFLATEAIKIGVYQYIDYSQMPKEYCGIMINSTILPPQHLML